MILNRARSYTLATADTASVSAFSIMCRLTACVLTLELPACVLTLELPDSMAFDTIKVRLPSPAVRLTNMSHMTVSSTMLRGIVI